MLRGNWDVVCPAGHVDRVTGITRNHDCEKCPAKSVDNGNARVKCPHCGMVDPVSGGTEQHLCSKCGNQTRR